MGFMCDRGGRESISSLDVLVGGGRQRTVREAGALGVIILVFDLSRAWKLLF